MFVVEFWRATKDELVLSGAYKDCSLQLEHGGYMAIMRAYHELHCLDWIKREWDPTRPLMQWHLGEVSFRGPTEPVLGARSLTLNWSLSRCAPPRRNVQSVSNDRIVLLVAEERSRERTRSCTVLQAQVCEVRNSGAFSGARADRFREQGAGGAIGHGLESYCGAADGWHTLNDAIVEGAQG